MSEGSKEPILSAATLHPSNLQDLRQEEDAQTLRRDKKKQALPMVRRNRSKSETGEMSRRLLPIAKDIQELDKMR
ncbi:hypothetical protein AV530_005177 [Patagioenas fasciata monilis]|uniref:Uncharacterized protein n=1 Tax=Patagioenas fasciata monilis TaxID=372326 RepID=A0A1V4K4A5_PATFA|nr:hypothetical protein AV530_005177 [Patagioenas fasciata monilis]